MSILAKGGAAAVASVLAFPTGATSRTSIACSFQWAPGAFFSLLIDDVGMKVNGPHQAYDAPVSRAANPEGTVYEALFPEGRKATLYDVGDASSYRLVLEPGGEVRCFP